MKLLQNNMAKESTCNRDSCKTMGLMEKNMNKTHLKLDTLQKYVHSQKEIAKIPVLEARDMLSQVSEDLKGEYCDLKKADSIDFQFQIQNITGLTKVHAENSSGLLILIF